MTAFGGGKTAEAAFDQNLVAPCGRVNFQVALATLAFLRPAVYGWSTLSSRFSSRSPFQQAFGPIDIRWHRRGRRPIIKGRQDPSCVSIGVRFRWGTGMFQTKCWATGAALVVSVTWCRVSAAATLHVPGDFATIQACIDAAVSGVDECIVAPGTYHETINFLGKAIALRSSGGAQVTIIDATGLDRRVAECTSGEAPDTVLQGFTLTGGRASRIIGGAGMYNLNSSPKILVPFLERSYRFAFARSLTVAARKNCIPVTPHGRNPNDFFGNGTRLHLFRQPDKDSQRLW